jgi:hypothetical protein
VETAELDTALEELELRLERLRALYEQYFMGLEKIEPQIARKDVDRRIYVLRREKIRNTAKRFKLQTIIQRYNTFQQYWQRICREIENGTYKRHLLKAQKNSGQLLTIAARKRLGRAARSSVAPEAAAPSQPPAPASAPPASPPPTPASVAAPPPVAASAQAPAAGLGAPPLPRRPPLPPRAVEGAAPPPAPSPAAAPIAPAPPLAAKPAPAPKAAPAKFESLDLDMDFMGDWDPNSSRSPAPKTAPVAKPAPPAAAAPKPALPATALPKSTAAAPARPASIPPAPVAVPPRPASSRPPLAPARPLPLRTPPSPRIPPAAPPPKPIARPEPRVAAPPKPAAAPAAPAPKPAPAATASAAVDDARMRDLHARLQQAKQQTNEANVSYEGLAKSVRATEAKLREQHKNRKIDFDVVIKDGKAVVKPIVR